jgi:hypothetical protein
MAAAPSFCKARGAQYAMLGRILYATSELSARDLGERLPRKRQSAAAQHLLQILSDELVPTAGSKSHSRAVVAAAVGDAGIAALGIDIEFMDDDRPLADIARFLSKSAPENIGSEQFFRCWTFAEAYFKAYQQLPPDRAVRRVGELRGADGECELDDGTHLLHRRIADRFLLCLVWRSFVASSEPRFMRA